MQSNETEPESFVYLPETVIGQQGTSVIARHIKIRSILSFTAEEYFMPL